MKDKHNTPPYKIVDIGQSNFIPPFNEEDLEKAQPKLHATLDDLKHVTLSQKKDLGLINHVISTNSRNIQSLQNDSGNYYQHLQELDKKVKDLQHFAIGGGIGLVIYIILDLFII